MTWPSLTSAKRWCVSVSTVALLLVLSSPAHSQNTLNVPAGYLTIQSAINAANNGDTVLVAAGTYVENINFNGKAITVTSSNGASATIIDGGAVGSVVLFSSSEGRGSVLSGFTITNGNARPFPYSGGGIYISNASPTVKANVITMNQACASGGGIYAQSSSALIQANTISNNSQVALLFRTPRVFEVPVLACGNHAQDGLGNLEPDDPNNVEYRLRFLHNHHHRCVGFRPAFHHCDVDRELVHCSLAACAASTRRIAAAR